MTSPTETFWPKFLLLVFVSGFWWAGAHGTLNIINSDYETPPPRTNTIQWENEQRANKELQEQYRKRVNIPAAAFGQDVSRAGALNAGNNSLQTAAPAQLPPAPAPGNFQKGLFYTVIFAVAGFFLVRKYTPEVIDYFSQYFVLWPAKPEPERVLPEHVRAEDESFDKFLTAFRVGPTAAATVDATADAPPVVDLAKEYYGAAAALTARQRLLMQDIVRETGGLARQKLLSDLRAEMNLLKAAADFPDALPVWQVATALEGLLKQLTDKMGNVTPSALRTVAGGVELLEELGAMGLQPKLLTDRALKFLVVDDEMISRHALSFALGKAFTKPDLVEDAWAALAQINDQAYDVIFLDVQMPGMDGFELCMKIHEIELNRTTPVVFVTGQGDFNARERSIVSGGNDLMGKPFLTFEVTVKALTLALHGRLHGQAPKLARGWDMLDPLLQSFAEPPRPAAISGPVLEPVPRAPAIAGPEQFTSAFLSRAAEHIEPLRELCRQLPLAADEAARQALLVDGFLRINSMIANTDSEMSHPACQMGIALEGLLRKLLENARLSSPSMQATLTAAVDVLHDLCAPGADAELAGLPPIELLVVDDDLLTRRTLVGALQTAFNRPESVESGEAALALAAEKPFDVIFMDVVMPGMDGFEACAKIRETAPNRRTPVVFVTGRQSAGTHEQMIRSGGSELLTKPFLTSEITVKALTFALRGRLQRAGTKV